MGILDFPGNQDRTWGRESQRLDDPRSLSPLQGIMRVGRLEQQRSEVGEEAARRVVVLAGLKQAVGL